MTVPVTNTGSRAGSEVVQCYVAPASPRLARPPKELKAFAKVWLEPGETTAVELVLDAPRVRLLGPGPGRLDGRSGAPARDVQLPVATGATP